MFSKPEPTRLPQQVRNKQKLGKYDKVRIKNPAKGRPINFSMCADNSTNILRKKHDIFFRGTH